MRKLKILIACPGQWTAGLDSQERGEGRWSQNWAKTLAKYGHEVYASSMGMPNPAYHYGVNLLSDSQVPQLGKVDLFIDAAWWDNKKQYAKFDYALHVHWGLEDFLLRPDFPIEHGIGFPYNVTAGNFICDRNPHKERTFFLPIPLRDKFDSPAFGRSDILIPHQASPAWPVKPDNAVITVDKLYSYIDKDPSIKAHWLFWDRLVGSPHTITATKYPNNTLGYSTLPYAYVKEIISKCKISVPLNGPSCIIDVIAQGVPYVAWEDGSFFTHIAKDLGISIAKEDETPERIGEVIDILMTDEKVYTEYVYALQDMLKDHTEENAMGHFNHAVEVLMG